MEEVAEQLRRFSPRPQHLLLLLLIGLSIYVILPQLGEFKASRHLLGQPRLGWTAAAVGFTGVTYLAAAATYCFLATRRLRYWRTVGMQLAAMFINRLLPGGVGALGANYFYLRHEKHTAGQAGSMVATNNLLGVLGHGLLMLVAFAVYGGRLPASPGHTGESLGMIFEWLVVGTAVMAVLLVLFGRHRFRRFTTDFLHQLSDYHHRPGRLAAALGSSMTLTMANVLCLYACAAALGLHIPIVAALLILTLGVGLGTAVPTPGGLGSFEAGLVAGLVAYRVEPAVALAVALLYRLISYWLALAVGAVAFAVADRRHWFSD